MQKPFKCNRVPSGLKLPSSATFPYRAYFPDHLFHLSEGIEQSPRGKDHHRLQAMRDMWTTSKCQMHLDVIDFSETAPTWLGLSYVCRRQRPAPCFLHLATWLEVGSPLKSKLCLDSFGADVLTWTSCPVWTNLSKLHYRGKLGLLMSNTGVSKPWPGSQMYHCKPQCSLQQVPPSTPQRSLVILQIGP